MDKNQSLIVDPKDFFSTHLNHASEKLKIQISDEVRTYLVGLLVEFINPREKVEILGEDSVLDSSLFEILRKAENSADWAEKVKILRCLGDVSLYVSGYFQDYFNRKIFDIRYYMDMGQMAYGTAANLTSQYHVPGHTQFEALAQNFTSHVDLLAEISESAQLNTKSDRNILALYDRWNRSKSSRLLKLLIEEGIDPIDTPTKIAQ